MATKLLKRWVDRGAAEKETMMSTSKSRNIQLNIKHKTNIGIDINSNMSININGKWISQKENLVINKNTQGVIECFLKNTYFPTLVHEYTRIHKVWSNVFLKQLTSQPSSPGPDAQRSAAGISPPARKKLTIVGEIVRMWE